MRVGCQEPFLDARPPKRVELIYDLASRPLTITTYSNLTPSPLLLVGVSAYTHDPDAMRREFFSVCVLDNPQKWTRAD